MTKIFSKESMILAALATTLEKRNAVEAEILFISDKLNVELGNESVYDQEFSELLNRRDLFRQTCEWLKHEHDGISSSK